MRLTFALLFILLLMLPFGAVAVDKDGWCFVQIADTQLGFINGNKDLTPEIDNFRKAVQFVNKLKPAFVVISGDMVNRAHNPRQIREFWKVAREIRSDVKLYLVAGNHDINPLTRTNVESYRKLFGPDYYSFSYNDTSFIVLDTNLIKDPGAVPELHETQRKWFETELKAAREKKPAHIFVLTHHPWFLTSPDEADAYFNIPKLQRQDYLDLMKQSGVEIALAGHYHREAIARDEKLEMITTSAVSKSLGKEPVGLRVFHIYPNHVEHTYYTLDQLPCDYKDFETTD